MAQAVELGSCFADCRSECLAALGNGDRMAASLEVNSVRNTRLNRLSDSGLVQDMEVARRDWDRTVPP